MEGMRTGLHHRIRRSLRQVEEQHGRLRNIAEELDRALGAGDTRVILEWLDHFIEALTAHFDLEEEMLFPALHGLEASLGPDVDRLTREHGEFLAVLRDLAKDAGMDPSERARVIGSVRIGLSDHERREEKAIGVALESTAGR